MPKSYLSEDLASILGGECNTNGIYITNFTTLSNAKQDSISFYYDPKYRQDLLETNAGIVILKKADSKYFKGPSIYVDDPYLAFAKASSIFNGIKKNYTIHKTSVIGKNTLLGKNISVGPNAVIGANCKVGENSIIESNATIADNVIIGSNVTIHSNVSIESNVRIGDHCELYSGSRIGNDGFGYAREKNKSWLKIPQKGSVIIGDNVDIGANSTIDRGAIDNTIIESGVKIDNLVQIGHNCIIGQNTIIAGCAGIAGSTIIGKNCMIGGAAMIKGHIKIADDTIISGGTGIGKSIENPGKRFTNVFPYNIEHKNWLRIANNLKKIGKKNE